MPTRQIYKKHKFEPVSLLTAEHGTLTLCVIPAHNQPDWLVPQEMVLSVDDFDERIWTYLWHGRFMQEVAVYHLVGRDMPVDKLVVLEGNTDVHRLALQTAGEIGTLTVRISDVKDAPLPEELRAKMLVDGFASTDLHYLFQTVRIHDKLYLVPDLDSIAHNLVDLDS